MLMPPLLHMLAAAVVVPDAGPNADPGQMTTLPSSCRSYHIIIM